MYSQLSNVKIDSVYTVVPKQEISIFDELEYYGNSSKKAERAHNMIGTHKRRVVPANVTASDLCAYAAQRLLEERNIDKNSIDALIFVTQSPDYFVPATACILQNNLKLSQHCAAFDVNQGCSGYVYGLWLASTMISSGACKNVLLLVGDAEPRPKNNRIIAPIFGDGGSATLLNYSKDAKPLLFSLGSDGSGFEYIIKPVGGARIPYSVRHEDNKLFFQSIQSNTAVPWKLSELYMDGAKVFDFTLKRIPQHINDFLNCYDININDLDYVLLHQANKQIVQEIGKRLGMAVDKTPCETFSRYGNLSSASIPAVFCDVFGEKGYANAQKLILCGYGVGLSWASCYIEAENIVCKPVLDYELPANHTTREQHIEQWQQRLKGE